MEPPQEAPLTTRELAEIARARAYFLAFVNAHFTGLPDIAFVDHIRGDNYLAALLALADGDTYDADIAGGAALMRNYLYSTLQSDAAALSDALGVDRTRLYRGVSPGYGPPPPYEAVWGTRAASVATVLQAIAEIYREAGMAISPESRERLDYIGVELDYQYQLAVREAEAWEGGGAEKARDLLKRQQSFVAEHTGQWIPLFAEKALPLAQTDFYRGHLMMLRGFLAGEQERLQAELEEVET